MTENQLKSDKQYAAYLARKFFSGQISKREILDQFPEYAKDFKMRLLFDRIKKKPRQSWFFGVSKKTYEKFIIETYEIIEDLESEKFRLKTMKRLFQELWLQSTNSSEPIQCMSILLHEVAKSTTNSKEEIRRYLNLLISKKYINRISDKPLLYEFTESGKEIKTDLDIEKIIKNVA
ncbi:hypothetical protein CJ739_2515 [Mariniflexile rhizosphaerae]|uniref:hypothetical protein n=1 Tax=unclassified Mariniflexile TaxID=2643887 RepID=UPI000E337A09|nr:hypothetical protein [Mariniflexile sp. TRM1-10]AXP81588.1 hypothetical protein CJ739_2515 [Mariniflexile sp. TRM1-10]